MIDSERKFKIQIYIVHNHLVIKTIQKLSINKDKIQIRTHFCAIAHNQLIIKTIQKMSINKDKIQLRTHFSAMVKIIILRSYSYYL